MISIESMKEAIIYDHETGKFYKRIGSEKYETRGREMFYKSNKKHYLYGYFKQNKFYAHRVAWAFYYGTWPKRQIDHINGDRQDNRIQNLRQVTHQENSLNLGRRRLKSDNPDSGVNGVCWYKANKKWVARIKFKGNWVYLGSYVNLDDAIKVRKEAEQVYGFHKNHSARLATTKLNTSG